MGHASLVPWNGSNRLARSLTEVNKLIFVQDFERASRVLLKLSKQFPADYEVQFRRIEVACRTEEIQDVCSELRERALQSPQVLALQYAATLAEIRLLEKQQNEKRESEELVNPSLSMSRSRGDVTGLSADSERIQTVAQRSSLPGILMGGGALGGRSAVSGPALPGQSFRVVRNPPVADDLPPADLPYAQEGYADLEAGSHPSSRSNKLDERYEIACIRAAHEAVLQHPNNYAAWFVAGCAFEYLGELSQAIEAWSKAIALEPNALSALATMAELQQIGAIPLEEVDYAERFEKLDRFLVHGTFETHSELFKEFLERKEFNLAIAALRTLGDWIQRQRGEVPPEIEILCLLGAMKAYMLEGNMPSAEACRREAENIAVACKKQPKNASQLAFIGQIAEEYGLPSLARMCYFSVLIYPDAPTDLIVRTAAHCVSQHPTPALKECLKNAYNLHKGHPEIRFCLLLCDLTLASVNIKGYMDRKNKIRTAITQNDIGTALQLMTESLKDTEEDPEIHYYLGEVLSKLGAHEQGAKHFQTMYQLDSLNTESALRYLQFLVKNRRFEQALELSAKAKEFFGLTALQQSELSWAAASAHLEQEKYYEGRVEIEKALRHAPWNTAYLALALRLHEPQETGAHLPRKEAAAELAVRLDKRPQDPLDTVLLGRLVERGRAAMNHGYVEYAFLLARTLFYMNARSEDAIEFFARAAASFNSRQATQQTLLLMQSKQGDKISFSYLATCVARIYCHSGEWSLVDEWIDIAVKSGVDDKFTRSKLFELEALKLTLNGTNLRKAQNLVEAAIDIYENGQKVPADTGVLHGYLLLAQGDIKGGMEKMQTHIGESSSIQSLYFLVKGLERAGRLDGSEKESIARLFSLSPTNTLEQRLIEEIYCTVGLHKSGTVVNLAC